MTRDQLIEFLKENYKPDEELIWQTIEFDDVVEDETISYELWQAFVESQKRYPSLADSFSRDVADEFRTFVEENNE
jgi:signal-transduction protein with cAMP-binding, CBS, and nucleotidyltransferase domain